MKDFAFVRLRYESGDWWVDERMPKNILDSLLQYTTLTVEPEERIVALSDPAVLHAPFLYLAGHRLVELDRREREHLERYVGNGGFLFVDDCNHDVDGLFARSFEAQVREVFGPTALQKLPNDHALYHAFFDFDDGTPKNS